MSDQNTEENSNREAQDVDLAINHQQFVSTAPVYVSLSDVSFDGFNYHLVFFSHGPDPVDHDARPNRLGVAARLVMPLPVAEHLWRELGPMLDQPKAHGIFAQLLKGDSNGNADETEP